MCFATSLKELSSIINRTCLENIASGQQQLVLKEAGKAAQGRLDKVSIINCLDPMVAVFPEKAKGDLFPFLRLGECQKVADAIVFTKYKSKPYILICEMKSGDLRGAKRQLLNTGLLATLIRQMAEETTAFHKEEWTLRYVLITTRSLKKHKTRHEKIVCGAEPNLPKEISVPNGAKIELGKLCS